MNSLLKISIIIPTYNRPDDLRKCIDSILKQTVKPQEIIVVDDGNLQSLPFISECETLCIDYRYHKKKGNRGPAASRNIGARQARGDVVFFLDDDVVLLSNYIEEIMKVYDFHPERAIIGGVGGIIANTTQMRLLHQLFHLVFLISAAKPGKILPSGFSSIDMRPKCFSRRKITQVDFLPGGVCSFRKEIFDEFSKAEKHIIHYPIDPQFKPTGSQYKFQPFIEKFRFKFLSVFEWVMRKDPYTLIEAFVEEFTPEEDVCLILRTWSKFRNPRKYVGELAKGHNVFWLPHDVPNMPALYRACDAFVTATWGEGFGHPIAEAMACGLKVIAPDSTGIKDYLNKNNGIPIPVKEEEVGHAYNEIPHLIKPWFRCWKPDKEELKKAMRKAFKNEMKFIRDNAVKIRDKYNIDNVLKEVQEAFDL